MLSTPRRIAVGRECSLESLNGAVFDSMDLWYIILTETKLAETVSMKHVLFAFVYERRKTFFRAKIEERTREARTWIMCILSCDRTFLTPNRGKIDFACRSWFNVPTNIETVRYRTLDAVHDGVPVGLGHFNELLVFVYSIWRKQAICFKNQNTLTDYRGRDISLPYN